MGQFFRTALLVIAAVAATATAAQAQQKFPSGAVRIIVPYVPGGGVDIAARTLGEFLSERWGSPVVVENRTGGATIVGISAVATAAPDGQTLLLTATPLLVNPTLQPNLPYDTLRDFAGVGMVVEQPVALVAHPSVGANKLSELVADMKQNDRTLHYGSSGIGGISHLLGEMFARTAGVKLTHVPYRGSAGATVDLLAGTIPLVFDSGFSAKSQVDAGKLKVLAISSGSRLPHLPNVPTFSEDYPGFEASSVQMLLAPGRTPRPVIERMSADVQGVVKSPAFAAKVRQVALEPIASTAEELDAYMRREIAKWEKVIREANIQSGR
ncbi:MAG: tripartite tricarboxylate transporter substrate binding protein [Xanthobacteraceae bacterium]|nr:tripartite tricarboxylate transporter substrate binding protein [Xanthobacteraceae bacterium]